jgi:energy-coupling factor transporter transmembrane protein EcfT
MSARATDAVAPLLLGAMVGSLIAVRLESAALCALAALATAAAVGAERPSRAWTLALLGGSAFAFALNLWLTPGTPLAGLPVLLGRAATREGAQVGTLLLLRMTGAFAAVQALRRVAAARWLAPLERLRVPVRETRVMLGLALRFAPLLREEAARIARVQALRVGRRPRGAGERLALARAAAARLSARSGSRWRSRRGTTRCAAPSRSRRGRGRAPRPWRGPWRASRSRRWRCCGGDECAR